MTGRGTYGKPRLTILDLTDSKEIHSSLLPSLLSEDREQAVLVTGGAGYIGSHLVRKLLDGGYRVRVLDNFLNGDRGARVVAAAIKNLQVVEGDIANIHDVVASLKDVGTVYGLAAIVGDAASSVDPEETLNLNYESTKVLVEACNFYEVRRLVFASSCSVYGASDHALLTEESPVNPVSLYARTRIMSEKRHPRAIGRTGPCHSAAWQRVRVQPTYALRPRAQRTYCQGRRRRQDQHHGR